MADFRFWQDRTDERVRNSEFANLVLSNRNFVISGVDVTTSSALTIAIASGKIFIDGDIVDVTGTTVTLGAADATYDRYDMIVINSSGTVSAIAGTAANPPRTPTYTEEDYVVVAGVIVESNETTLVTDDIYNIGIENNTLGKIERGASDPASGAVGELFYNTTDSKLKYYDGAAWAEVGAGGGVNSYSETFTSQTSFTVTHNLADSYPIVQVYDNNNEQIQPSVIDITDSNSVLIEFFASQSGWVRILGGESAALTGGVGTYLHDQTSTATTWTVTHNLNDLNPSITVFDSSGDPVESQSISVVDSNSFTVTFGITQTGKVRVLAGKFSGGTGTGDFLPDTDNSYDVGSAALSWKDGYFDGDLTVGGTINGGGSAFLGELKFIALSVSGAVTKSSMQTAGWAICDGTDIVTTQGITGATITGNAPDLQHTFIRMSNDESSGGTGGSDTHSHELPIGYDAASGTGQIMMSTLAADQSGNNLTATNRAANTDTGGDGTKPSLKSKTESTLPTYYEAAFFIKVK